MELVLIILLAFTPLVILVLAGLSCNPLKKPEKQYVYYDDHGIQILVLPARLKKLHMRMYNLEYLGEL